MVYTTIRDALDIERQLMNVCPEWHRASECAFILSQFLWCFSNGVGGNRTIPVAIAFSALMLCSVCRVMSHLVQCLCARQLQCSNMWGYPSCPCNLSFSFQVAAWFNTVYIHMTRLRLLPLRNSHRIHILDNMVSSDRRYSD